MASQKSALFSAIKVGTLSLQHRVVLAPMTRMRATPSGAPSALAKEYYAQRADAPGTLLITEATSISARAGGFSMVAGIFSDEQIAAWKEVFNVFARFSNSTI